MPEDNVFTHQTIKPGLLGAYLKLGSAIVVGAAMALGIYFFVLQNASLGQQPNNNQNPALCVCPNCGLTVRKPANMDCEEIQCPNCAHSMNPAAVMNGAPQAATGVPPTGGMTQNQRETLAEQGIVPGQNPNRPATPPPSPLLAAMTPPAPSSESGICVCPSCGQTVTLNPGFSCSRVACPNCSAGMTNALMVGRAPAGQASPMQLAAVQAPDGQTGACPLHNGTGTQQMGGGTGTQQMGGGTGMHQMHGGMHPAMSTLPGTGRAHIGAMPTVGQITYANTVQGIVEKNCYRCHSGPFRNLTTYDNVKGYVNNGLLMMMVQPGGPMSRFLSADEAHQIIAWMKAGAPQ